MTIIATNKYFFKCYKMMHVERLSQHEKLVSQLTRFEFFVGGVSPVSKDQALLVSKAVSLHKKIVPKSQLLVLSRRVWVINQYHTVRVCHNRSPP